MQIDQSKVVPEPCRWSLLVQKRSQDMTYILMVMPPLDHSYLLLEYIAPL